MAYKDMDPLVRDYLLGKQTEAPKSDFDAYQASYGPEAFKKAQDQAEAKKEGLGWSQFAAGVGSALAGRGPSETSQDFQKIRQGIDESTIGALEKQKASALGDIKTKQMLGVSDPNSRESIAFRRAVEANFPKIAELHGPDWQNVSAADKDLILDPLKMREQRESRLESSKALAQERQAVRGEKEQEKIQKLKTPFGLANTEDDAKKLKEAFESKKNFDNKIEEMIRLRQEHGGGTLLDRESVARGKQLSKDLLLEYKNMAKLGVLSAADEAIINAIIPADPLAYNSPIAAIQGQDPILNNLVQFKRDSDKDFKNRIATRTRSGVETAAQQPVSSDSDVESERRRARILELKAKVGR